MVGGASWDWIFVVNVFSVFRGLRGPKVLRSSCTKGSFSLALPTPPSAPKAFVANSDPRWYWGKKHITDPPLHNPQKKYPPTFTTAHSELFFLSPDKKTNNHT